MREAFRTVLCVVLFSVLFATIVAQEKTDCGEKLTPQTETTQFESELYFLSILERNERVARLIALQHLLDLDELSEQTIIQKIYECEDVELLKRSYMFMLFAFEPDKHEPAVRSMMKDTIRVAFTNVISTGPPSRGDGESMLIFGTDYGSFYIESDKYLLYDWGGTAATLLVRHGVLDKEIISELSRIAMSDFYDIRLGAQNVFKLFEGIPPYDVGVQIDPPLSYLKGEIYGWKGYNKKVAKARKTNVKAITNWLKNHFKDLKWSPETKTYILSSKRPSKTKSTDSESGR